MAGDRVFPGLLHLSFRPAIPAFGIAPLASTAGFSRTRLALARVRSEGACGGAKTGHSGRNCI